MSLGLFLVLQMGVLEEIEDDLWPLLSAVSPKHGCAYLTNGCSF